MTIQYGGRGLDEDGWDRVTRNTSEHLRRITGTCWDSFRGKSKVTEDITTYFLFTCFSNSHGAKEMFNIFENYGILDEVVIPPKRDKRDNVYGFVRF